MDKTELKTPPFQHNRIRIVKEGALIGWLLLCAYLLLALTTYSPEDPGWSTTATNASVVNAAGPAGAWLADVSFSLFGYLAYLFPLMIGFRVVRAFVERHQQKPFDAMMLYVRIVGLLLVIIAGTGLVSLHSGEHSQLLPFSNGGITGLLIATAVERAFAFTGANILLLAMGLFGVTIFTDLSWFWLMDKIGMFSLRLTRACHQHLLNFLAQRKARKAIGDKLSQRKENIALQLQKNLRLMHR